MIDITGLDKAEVLMALYGAARVQGLGIFHQRREPLPYDEAVAVLARTSYVDYLHGRVLKVELGGETLDEYLYDRDNGPGAALRALAALTAPRAAQWQDRPAQALPEEGRR
jgi:hypothetical protein